MSKPNENPLVYTYEDEEGVHLVYPRWVNTGSMLTNRDCLHYNNPNHTYNLIKSYGYAPEEYGIEHPLVQIKREEFDNRHRDDLILEIIRLRDELEECYRYGWG